MRMLNTMLEWAQKFFTDIWGWLGAGVGLVISLWTGMPALGRGILIVQGADILSGLACAILGKSPKSESGKVSSRAMLEGMIKKGAEWLIVLVCVYTGTPLGMEGICSAAMTDSGMPCSASHSKVVSVSSTTSCSRATQVRSSSSICSARCIGWNT